MSSSFWLSSSAGSGTTAAVRRTRRSSRTSRFHRAQRLRTLIAILGDTHLPRGSRQLPDACVEILRDADLIVHTGDFVSLAAFEDLRGLGRVEAVHGNMDEPALREALPSRIVVEQEGLRIGIVHSGGPRAGREARLRGWFPDCDLVAYGHSHLPEVQSFDSRWIVNPGSPTERRGAPAHTMAVVENGVPRLVEVQG